MEFSKDQGFIELCSAAAACTVCPELADKRAVLSELNGSLQPKVFFIAEAPGRQGADRTRRPFYGDKSGENFQALLDSIGLSRDEIFITNSVMCSPRTATDANRKPMRTEIRNCSVFLKRTIELIDPPLLATLGSVALDALKLIEPHDLTLKNNAGRPAEWNGRRIIPLYHPSPQVIAAQRGLGLQLEHFQTLKHAIEQALA
ncbi:MAG: uracil-DNA glycosylase [Pyrinomonadaceae bacterium]|nr:uracil-DNA glycosylase [Pyrinomonadaceae bacterium]